MAVKIFVSSTWLDLQPERQATEAVIHRLHETKFIGMEYFGSRDETTQRASLDELDRSDVYVGIFGGRYGSGITEEEYRRARTRGLPCFIYLKDNATIAVEQRETENAKVARLDALKAELRQHHTYSIFINPADLATKVATDLHQWLFDQYLTPRLEQAARGERPPQEAQLLLNAIKDWDSLPPDLLQQLRRAGFNITSGTSNIAVSGGVSDGVINTGSGNFNVAGEITITGDGNAIGHQNTVTITKTTAIASSTTAADFASLLIQLRDLVPIANLPEDDRSIIETNLKTVEKEAQKEKPRLSIVESSLKTVESLFKSTESIGSMIPKLLSMVTQAVEMAKQLFP